MSYPAEWKEVSLQAKIDAGFRCVRCGHPNGIWCPDGTDPGAAAEAYVARHAIVISQPLRFYSVEGGTWIRHHLVPCDERCTHDPEVTESRILTVHHLDGVKANLAWWNLAPLCQRCHLEIQGRVKMEQAYLHPHSDWFLPYVAGFYAATVAGEQLTRREVEERLPELLILGQPHLADHYVAQFGTGAPA